MNGGGNMVKGETHGVTHLVSESMLAMLSEYELWVIEGDGRKEED